MRTKQISFAPIVIKLPFRSARMSLRHRQHLRLESAKVDQLKRSAPAFELTQFKKKGDSPDCQDMWILGR